MQNRDKFTSPNPSTPDPGSRNAFSREFLKQRHDREDEPLAAVEAESRGPWVVFVRPVAAGAAHDAERYEIYRTWEDPEKDTPAAAFRFRELAFLYAAAMEVGGRRSTLTVERDEPGSGFEVSQLDLDGNLMVVGHLAQWDEDTFPAFQNLETLLRAIEPLAQVLDAAGSSIVELLGRRLLVE